METTRVPSHPPSSTAREHAVPPDRIPGIAEDPHLFEIFYRQNVERVQRFIVRRIGERERAADLVAEIFLAVIDSASGYKPERGTPTAWLYGIARIVIANDARRREFERAREDRWRARELLDEDDAERMDARIDAAARSRCLYEAMDLLSEAERAVLELVALDELTVAEAAAATGIRPVTARVRLHRARRKLRDELEPAASKELANEEVGS